MTRLCEGAGPASLAPSPRTQVPVWASFPLAITHTHTCGLCRMNPFSYLARGRQSLPGGSGPREGLPLLPIPLLQIEVSMSLSGT